ncbi:MAG: molecular chaperone [Novosphingobium sp.]|nr:molecular chaperone [Novosphingobium sp.]
MKRFWREVTVERTGLGWEVALDGRKLRTARGVPQAVPTRALAEALAEEWRAQDEVVDSAGFILRDLADYAIDVVGPDRGEAIGRILKYAESDTLCYRAEPDEPLAARQREVWEPLLKACEQVHGVRFVRAAGVLHRAQPQATLGRLRARLDALCPFQLAALQTLASLAASLVVGLAALEPEANASALYAAANLEQDWQAGLWGWEPEAEARRGRKLAEFTAAARFAALARK